MREKLARYERGGKQVDIVVQRGLLLVVLLVLVDHVLVEGLEAFH